jgi:hypothetical protein
LLLQVVAQVVHIGAAAAERVDTELQHLLLAVELDTQ